MQEFLLQTAQKLFEKHPKDLADIAIILPNRRASLFLKKHFSTLIDQPIWSPTIISEEEFLENLADVSILDSLNLQFELHAVYQKTVPKDQQEPFDQFLQWAQILLQDFNEIDRYLIPPDKIFGYVNEARALEVWNVNESEISEVQHKYLQFWKQMESLYFAFKDHLKAKQLAYPGLSYRWAVESLNPDKIIDLPYQKIYFCGFNALTAAEQTIFEQFVENGKAEIIFDADEYYVNDELQEAGLFLRQLKKKKHFAPFFDTIGKHFQGKKKIDIYAVPKNVGQCKLAGNLLSTIDSKENFKDTAVVLADENLLLPMLQSLPDEVNAVNITMGYPLNNSPIYTFFERFLALYSNAENQKEQKGKILIYHKDVFNLLDHPFMKTVFPELKNSQIKLIKSEILKHQFLYLTKDQLESIDKNLSDYLFKNNAFENINELIKNILWAINQAKTQFEDKEETNGQSLQMEYLFHFAKIFNRILELQESYHSIDKMSTFYSIFKNLTKQATIPFFGEPLSGLQMMGVLETRTIDFKNLILLSVNEGVLPSGKSINSFIPYDIKRQFGLPTHKEKDAIYAYHFYRLIQRAENVSILYNSEVDEFGGGEKSRFIEQMLHELKIYNPNIDINEKLIQTSFLEANQEFTTIEKTDNIKDSIKSFLKKGVSPTALNTFINCPLDFYYKYILKLDEAEVVEETIPANIFGEIIHSSLEEAYKDLIGKNTNTEMIGVLKKIALTTCEKEFINKFSLETISFGKNKLAYQVALKYIQLFFEEEKSRLKGNQLRIIQLEANYKVPFQFNDIEVILKGKADRVDEFNNQLRVIDYKSGSVYENKLVIKKPLSELTLSEYSQAIQLLMYAYMHLKSNNLSTLPEASIISMRKLKMWTIPLQIENDNSDKEVIESFENLLKEVFTDMLSDKKLEHNKEAKYCVFCGS